MEQGVLSDKAFIASINENAVAVFAHCEEKHGTVEVVDPKTKEKSVKCKLHPDLTCKEHTAIYSDAAGKYGISGLPTTIIAKPDGTEVKKIAGPSGAKEFDAAIKETQKVLGPGLTKKEYAAHKAAIEKAEAEIAKDKPNYQNAIKDLQKITKLKDKVPQGVVDEAQGVLDKVNEVGVIKLAEARNLIPIKVDFKGLPVEAEAANALKELKDMPAGK
jgi:hypothetical protein